MRGPIHNDQGGSCDQKATAAAMARHTLACAALLWGAAAAHAAQDLPPGCVKDDAACVAKALREHPVRKISMWQASFGQPVVERVQRAPAPLVEYLRWDNTAQGFAERPHSSEPPTPSSTSSRPPWPTCRAR